MNATQGAISTMMRELSRGVTFDQFAALAKAAGWTTKELAGEFRGRFETGNESIEHWFERVISGEPGGDVVIPFRSLLEKYIHASRLLIADKRIRACVCGCGSPVFGRYQLAWADCPNRGKVEQPVP